MYAKENQKKIKHVEAILHAAIQVWYVKGERQGSPRKA